jgi:UDP-N-acetylglucosamine--N-acetylmuramyl-(pentapeptide) pyrophosphoryl-undecaprenol N-acetylglucosamine transferase
VKQSESRTLETPAAVAARPFVFFGGGTGGHVAPALAVAEALERALPGRGVRPVVFTGRRRGERPLTRGRGGPVFRAISLARPRRVPVRFALESIASFDRLAQFVRVSRPAVCVGLGGYLSLPGVAAARMAGVPTVLLEQNCVPGRVNRLLAPVATCVCTSFAGPEARLRARRVVCTGNPVRADFARLRADPRRRPVRPWRTVAVLGGSQGAQALNDAVVQALPAVARLGAPVRFVHAAGPGHERIARAYARWGLGAAVAPFFTDIAERIAGADLALCRAGGSTLAELLVLGVPAVLVPYPGSRDGHQEANAQHVAARGGGVVCRQRDLTGNTVAGYVRELVNHGDRWQKRARAAYRMGRPEASRAVAEVVLGCAGGGGRCVTSSGLPF